MADWTSHLPRDRPTARILVIDELRRLLLFRAPSQERSGRMLWFTPGGGVEPGETFEGGAVRELWEETGLRVDDIGHWVWRRDRDFRGIRFRERYFVVYANSFEPMPGAPDSEHEQYMQEEGWFRWWSHEELRTHRGPDLVLPPDLPKFLPPILDGRLPSPPIELDR